jgi:hypothetical protein
MRITELSEELALILPVVILVEGIVGVVVWFVAGSRGGRAARFAAWVGFVTLTLWCGSAAAFVLLHLLLFAFGSTVAMAGAIAITVFMVLMPFGWAAVVRHRAQDRSTTASH